MRMIHSVAILALLTVSAIFAPAAAHADTITFGSGINTVSYSNTSGSGTVVVYTGTNPYSIANYVAPVSGTAYITYDNSTEFLPAGVTTYSMSLTGPAGAAGSIAFAADNSVVVFLNGTEIGASDTFNALTDADFTLGSGSNTLTFVVTNDPTTPDLANPTALDFGGSVTFTPPPSTVPEPSSIALLGTGLLSIAGLTRRKSFRS